MSRLADIVAEFTSILNDSSVTIAVGAKELHRNDSPPRIVFERVGGPIEMTRDIGRQDTGATAATRALLTRNLALRVHCWGEDEDQAEDLMHNALVAMRSATLGSFAAVSETWGRELESGDANLGEVVIAEVVVQIPVIDALLTLHVPPTTWQRDAEFGTETGACG